MVDAADNATPSKAQRHGRRDDLTQEAGRRGREEAVKEEGGGGGCWPSRFNGTMPSSDHVSGKVQGRGARELEHSSMGSPSWSSVRLDHALVAA